MNPAAAQARARRFRYRDADGPETVTRGQASQMGEANGCGVAHVRGLKKAQKSLPPKQQRSHRCRKQTSGYQGVRGGGGEVGGWDGRPHGTEHGASPAALVVKNLPASAGATGDWGCIPGSGRPPAGGGNPLQCSCLEKPLGRGAWWATVHGPQRVRHD